MQDLSLEKNTYKVSRDNSCIGDIYQTSVFFLTNFCLFSRCALIVCLQLDRRVVTHLSCSRSARSQIVELVEKIDVAIALYKWSKVQ